MKEKVNLTVTKYVTPDGKQTCALNFVTGEVCTFYRTQRFGTFECCLFMEDYGGFVRQLKRDVGSNNVLGDGFLIPDKECPIRRGTFDPPKIFKPGDRVKVFDHLLYINDILTPSSETIQPAIVVRGNYTNSHHYEEEMIDVLFDREDRVCRRSNGHFVWSVEKL